MVNVRIEDVTRDEHRKVLNDLIEGEYLYEPAGERVDADTYEFEFSHSEYAVVMDEFLDEKQKEVVHAERYFAHRDIYNLLPKSSSVENDAEITVSIAEVLSSD